MHTDAFKKALEAEEARLTRELGGTRAADAEEMDAPPEPDPVDEAAIATDRDANSAIVADLEARLASVNDALARIKDGSYGVCEVCKKKIEPERLRADPAATTCIQHK